VRRVLVLIANGLGFIAAAAIVIVAGQHFARAKGALAPPPLYMSAHHAQLSYLGVYEPTSPQSYSGVEEFSRLIGRRPNIAVYYSAWWEPFQSAFARAAEAQSAIPMVQIEPRGVSLADITSGDYDSYLRAYASAVRSFGRPVILSFGHEMNADWYSWGYRHTSAAVFVAAWRHIHELFAAMGASNVTWLWTVNVVNGRNVSAIRAWWPGAHMVNWVGVDGHYFQSAIRFSGLFDATLAQIRRLTRDPVLIAETGIAPFVATERITDLFAGAQAHRLLGVVWFDVTGHNIRIEGDPSAIALFRRAVRAYFKPPAAGIAR